MIDKIDKVKCTGCKMCGDICPQEAIAFKSDKEGFWYPVIDETRCNRCGACMKKCPSLNNDFFCKKDELEVYAAWSRDYKVRCESTSGGIFWEIARKFMEAGGIVVGARWGDDWKSAEHFIAYNFEELTMLRGSKYIQSDTAGIYKRVKEELRDGKKVLFCGTPCQNAAMQMYLQKNEENIFYFDFICRSINSPLAFKAYVSELEKQYGSAVKLVHLKNKKKGWQSLATQVVFENGEESLKDRNEDLWIKGFVGNDLYTRESCFQCQYRELPRKTSDITVGDFWGIKNEAAYDMFRGISVVMVNTEKGKALLEGAAEGLVIKERSIEEVLPGNFALLKNPVKSEKKKKFFEMLETNDFSKCVYGCTDILEKSELDIYQMLEQDVEKYKNRGEIDKEKYLYLNFFCKSVIHKGNGKIIPYKNSVIDIQDTSRIIIEGDADFEVGTNVFKGSKAETLIRLGRYAIWVIKHGGYFFYGTTLEVKENALFESGYFSANSGSVIIAAKHICFGEDVMIGRNVMIYDSDFHQILDAEYEQVNSPQDVVIEDHVWLTANINVNKGVRIGQGSIIANQTVVNKDVPAYSLVAGQSVGKVIKQGVSWSRTPVKRYDNDIKNKKMILYGYGVVGKKFYLDNKDKIAYVVDNYVKEDNVLTFTDFIKQFSELNRDEYMWVIASLNHYDEFYNQIRLNYRDMLIVSVADL